MAERDEKNYYSLLNVTKEATDEEIREAYHKLSRLYHPDRHSSTEARQWSSMVFHEIQTAYETLTDPVSRAAYDVLGSKGLVSSTEVGSKIKTRAEFLKEYEIKAALEQEKKLANLVGTKSEFVMEIDTRLVTSNAIHEELQRRGLKVSKENTLMDKIIRTKFVAKHSFSIPVYEKLKLNFYGSAAELSGRKGIGKLNVGLQYADAPGRSTEVALGMLGRSELHDYKALSIKRNVQIDTESFYNIQANFQSLQLATPPVVSATLGRVVFGTVTGYIGVNTGNQYNIGPYWEFSPARYKQNSSKKGTSKARSRASLDNETVSSGPAREFHSFTLGLAGINVKDVHIQTSAVFSIPQQQLSVNATHQFDPTYSITAGLFYVVAGNQIPLKLHDARQNQIVDQRIYRHNMMTHNSTQAVVMNLGVEMSVNEFTTLGYAVHFGLNQGTSLVFKYSRLGQQVKIPILLSPTFELELVANSVVYPVLLSFLYNLLVVRPSKVAKLKEKMEEYVNFRLQKYQLSKLEHEKTIKYLNSISLKKLEYEKSVNGLIITLAKFGDLESESNTIDVTTILMAYVSNSRLAILSSNNKDGIQDIVGFYNPINNLSGNETSNDDQETTIYDNITKNAIKSWFLNKFMYPKDLISGAYSQPELLVEYTFNSNAHRVVLKNHADIILPLKAHLIS
ncbi:putative J domain-containing protein [Zancudomyces culisetae]|uniref:Putative J domain-containing protein n=1 Tax=Zancudomyces culisetae TaxID=1213189 RepID=A0A1R1PY05_ZANCU|nr:putative J domain-containing protein [Zancudomyces culisetae]|eukprot:OMH85823.1 putative J domain-containing protein [Zancudomyces culisetae]